MLTARPILGVIPYERERKVNMSRMQRGGSNTQMGGIKGQEKGPTGTACLKKGRTTLAMEWGIGARKQLGLEGGKK